MNQVITDKILLIYEIKDCFMIIFFSKIEIDGFFVCNEEFNITDYKAEEILSINKSEKGLYHHRKR